MNDTNREAVIRTRLKNAQWRRAGGHALFGDDWYAQDVADLLSALDSEREARRELFKLVADLRLVVNGATNIAAANEIMLRAGEAVFDRVPLTTEDSNKTPTVHTERNE